uniref:LRRNT_2 domain-containing protein n=1 Tax=Globodera pallida TaxID=36090 RepID=A0A183CJY2_GLOPA
MPQLIERALGKHLLDSSDSSNYCLVYRVSAGVVNGGTKADGTGIRLHKENASFARTDSHLCSTSVFWPIFEEHGKCYEDKLIVALSEALINLTGKIKSLEFPFPSAVLSASNRLKMTPHASSTLNHWRGQSQEVAYYSGASNKLNQMANFHWVGGKPPRDSPVCGWDHSKCPEGYPAHTLEGFVVLTQLRTTG